MRWLTPKQYRQLERTHRTWLVPGLIPAGTRVLLIGGPKAGKSFFAIQMTYQFAKGEGFFGYTPERPLRIAYVDVDSPEEELDDRLELLMADVE